MRRRFRRKAVEHINRGFAGASAHAACFGDIGDEKSFAAGFSEFGRNRLKTKSICVRLDHGSAFDRQKLPRECAPVRLDGIRSMVSVPPVSGSPRLFADSDNGCASTMPALWRASGAGKARCEADKCLF